jgi:integrase
MRPAPFDSLTEKVETGRATVRLVCHLFAALAVFERNLISERTKDGLNIARKRCNRGGRKPTLVPELVKLLIKDCCIRPEDLARPWRFACLDRQGRQGGCLMATLEYIRYIPHQPEIDAGTVKWAVDKAVRIVDRLPQVFWGDGVPWREVNLWALEMSRNRDVKLRTVVSALEHLHKYAIWLEETPIDWRHFPQTKAERVLVRYRGHLIDEREASALMPSTTTARMNAVIRFYRFAAGKNFISREAPKWQDIQVVLPYFDTTGFERTMIRVTTDVSIPNHVRSGLRLEDGLLPLTQQHKLELLEFAHHNASPELCLMLMTGFFTGARIGTIITLRTTALDNAIRDPALRGMWLVKAGPGTGIATKFDVTGDLLIPDQLMAHLKAYATSIRHISRVIKAADSDKTLVFLTRFSAPYKDKSVDREMVDLRRAGQAAGLKFLRKFKFHQTRATYGTWLMKLCLEVSSPKAAIEFVKQAMFHKDAATTFGYVTFNEKTKESIAIEKAFAESFMGLSTRLSWPKRS